MKLGAIYTVFNGIELLEGSINQIYPYVDKIIISYQDISNRGEIREGLREELKRFEKDKVEYQFFKPDLSRNTKENERRKLNNAIQYLKAKGYTHYVLLATDHYFLKDEFIKAKIKANEYDVTLTKMYTYFKKPTWQLAPIEQYQMPFICKIYPDTEVSMLEYKGFRTDPSVRINTRNKIYCFYSYEIMMHHYSMVRSDIENKFSNAAASVRWTKEQIEDYKNEYKNYDIILNPGIKYFGGRKIKIVPNHFNISLPE